jgi:hypothetical protein
MDKEKVRVGAVFEESGKIRPIWFGQRRQKHQIREINYHWTHQRGKTLYHHFAVTDDGGTYELIYNTDDGIWLIAGMPAS